MVQGGQIRFAIHMMACKRDTLAGRHLVHCLQGSLHRHPCDMKTLSEEENNLKKQLTCSFYQILV